MLRPAMGSFPGNDLSSDLAISAISQATAPPSGAAAPGNRSDLMAGMILVSQNIPVGLQQLDRLCHLTAISLPNRS